MYINEFNKEADLAADPVIAYMTPEQMERSIENIKQKMLQAARDMEFIEAARLRDEMLKMQAKLTEMQK